MHPVRWNFLGGPISLVTYYVTSDPLLMGGWWRKNNGVIIVDHAWGYQKVWAESFIWP